MLRELNENEMEMVSGGFHEEGHDEVVVTAQRLQYSTPIDPEMLRTLTNASMSELMATLREDLALQGIYGGGGTPSENQPADEHCHGLTTNQAGAVTGFLSGLLCASTVALTAGTAGVATPVAAVACGTVAAGIGYATSEMSSGQTCH